MNLKEAKKAEVTVTGHEMTGHLIEKATQVLQEEKNDEVLLLALEEVVHEEKEMIVMIEVKEEIGEIEMMDIDQEEEVDTEVIMSHLNK